MDDIKESSFEYDSIHYIRESSSEYGSIHYIRESLFEYEGVDAVSYTHLTLPTNREV